jgi:hypothetical protein
MLSVQHWRVLADGITYHSLEHVAFQKPLYSHKIPLSTSRSRDSSEDLHGARRLTVLGLSLSSRLFLKQDKAFL